MVNMHNNISASIIRLYSLDSVPAAPINPVLIASNQKPLEEMFSILLYREAQIAETS